MEKGSFEVHYSEPLLQVEEDFSSVPIHCFVAREVFTLFTKKHETIHMRMRTINESRMHNYHMAKQTKPRFGRGKVRYPTWYVALCSLFTDAGATGDWRGRREYPKRYVASFHTKLN